MLKTKPFTSNIQKKTQFYLQKKLEITKFKALNFISIYSTYNILFSPTFNDNYFTDKQTFLNQSRNEFF